MNLVFFCCSISLSIIDIKSRKIPHYALSPIILELILISTFRFDEFLVPDFYYILFTISLFSLTLFYLNRKAMMGEADLEYITLGLLGGLYKTYWMFYLFLFHFCVYFTLFSCSLWATNKVFHKHSRARKENERDGPCSGKRRSKNKHSNVFPMVPVFFCIFLLI